MATPTYEGSYNKLFPKKMSTNSFLTIYTLHVLAHRNEKMYGKEIIDKIEERFNSAFKPSHGLMYPILRKLEEQGLVKAHWEGNDPSKKTKRFYQITTKGRLALQEEVEEFKPVVYETFMMINGVMKDLYNPGNTSAV
jgi:PadR family transcriptional regulator, regulatory protein PadR